MLYIRTAQEPCRLCSQKEKEQTTALESRTVAGKEACVGDGSIKSSLKLQENIQHTGKLFLKFLIHS